MEAQAQQYQPYNEVSDSTASSPVAAIEGVKANQPLLPPATASNQKWQQIGEQVSDFLAQLPNNLGRFFTQYQQLIVTLVLIASALVTLKVLFAILDAINDIPLVYPFFELVGLGYTTWFVFRYLIKASTRQELAAQLQSITKETTGSQDS
ncbi:hypothetical protein NUACC21_06320 [Scytonema sp. NUACC21]